MYIKKTNNPKMGRPTSDNPKSTQLAVRLDAEALRKLDALAEKNSETRVQTIRRGINRLYEDFLKK